MTIAAARTLAIARIAFACAVALTIAYGHPNAARLFASFARPRMPAESAGAGWLGAAVTNLLYAGPLHYGALVAAGAFGALSAFALVERRARLHATAAGAFGAAVLAALCSLDTLRAGGGSATLAFAAAVMLLLEDATLLSALGLGPLAMLWCNFEPAGVLAPALAVVAAVGRTFDRAGTPAARRAWLGAAIATCATLATPLGSGFPGHALAALQLAGASADYARWSPADLAPYGYRYGVMSSIAIALGVGLRGRNAREALLGAFAFVLALASGAFVGVFGIVAAPIVVAALARRPGGAAQYGARATLLRAAGALAVLALVAGFAAGARTLPLGPREPYAAIARLARVGGVHRVFCSDTGWCDAALADGMAVLAGSRIANAPPAVRDAQITIARVRKTWRTELNAHGIDAAVTGANSALATLLTQSHWTRFATAGTTVILLRRAPAS